MLEYLMQKYGKATLSVNEVSCELGVDKETVQGLVKRGLLKVLPLGTEPVISVHALISFLSNDNKEKTVSPTYCESVNNEVSSISTEEFSEKIIYEEEYGMVKGYISHLADGRFIMQIDFGKKNGKRVRESKSFRSEEDAKNALTARLQEVEQNNGKVAVNIAAGKISGRTKLHDFMNEYLKLDLTSCSTVTKECYYYAAGKISEEIGQIPIEEITEELVIKVLNEMKEKYAQSTLDKVRITLKMILQYAYKKKYITQNPVEDLRVIKSKIIKQEIVPYTKEEIRNMLDKSKEYPELYPILCMFACTSCRPEEIRALKWSNLNLEKGIIKIDSAIVTERIDQGIGKRGRSKEKEGCTKSTSGVRTLPISEEAIQALLEWKEYINVTKKYKYAKESKYIFCGENNSFLLDSALRLRFNRFIKKIGKEKQGYFLYKFRHTYCTNICKQGVPLDKVQRLMGDSTTAVILNIYNHVKDEDTYEYAQGYFNSDLMA